MLQKKFPKIYFPKTRHKHCAPEIEKIMDQLPDNAEAQMILEQMKKSK